MDRGTWQATVLGVTKRHDGVKDNISCASISVRECVFLNCSTLSGALSEAQKCDLGF